MTRTRNDAILSHRQISTGLPKPQSCLHESARARELLLLLLIYTVRGLQQHQLAAAVAHLRWKSKLGIPHMTSGLSLVTSRCVALVSLHPASVIVLRIAAGFTTSSVCCRSRRFRKSVQGSEEGSSTNLHEHSPQLMRIWTRGFSSAENCGTLDTESTRDGAVASPPVPTTAIRPRIVDMASCSLSEFSPARRCVIQRIPRGYRFANSNFPGFERVSLPSSSFVRDQGF
jgi:hypothetical protein